MAVTAAAAAAIVLTAGVLTVAWPRKAGALGTVGSDAIVSRVKSAPGAIGYVGVSYLSQVMDANEGEAALGNSSGNFVLPAARAILITLSDAQIARIKG